MNKIKIITEIDLDEYGCDCNFGDCGPGDFKRYQILDDDVYEIKPVEPCDGSGKRLMVPIGKLLKEKQ